MLITVAVVLDNQNTVKHKTAFCKFQNIICRYFFQHQSFCIFLLSKRDCGYFAVFRTQTGCNKKCYKRATKKNKTLHTIMFCGVD